MNHNPPVDKFVMPIYVPDSIWVLYVVFTLPCDLAALQNLADMVDSSERLDNARTLYTMTLGLQMPHHIVYTGLRMLRLE